MSRTLSLRSRFILWTSATVVVSSAVLTIGVYAVSARAMKQRQRKRQHDGVRHEAEYCRTKESMRSSPRRSSSMEVA